MQRMPGHPTRTRRADMAKARRKPARGAVAPPVDSLETERIALGLLRYDPMNPRIVERLGEKPKQGDIEALLLSGEFNARELVPSFIENGYIPYDPLIVRPDGGVFVVVE